MNEADLACQSFVTVEQCKTRCVKHLYSIAFLSKGQQKVTILSIEYQKVKFSSTLTGKLYFSGANDED